MLDMAQARDDWFSKVLPVNVTNAMSEEAALLLGEEHLLAPVRAENGRLRTRWTFRSVWWRYQSIARRVIRDNTQGYRHNELKHSL